MRLAAPFLHVACLAVLVAMFSGELRSASVDVVSHFALVDELMKFGRVRPEDTNLGWGMPLYPPLSHWAAALLGWLTGSGLVAMSLISIAAVYAGYCAIGWILTAGGSLAALVTFAVLFVLLAGTHALLGWEVVGNFFYPHLVSSALYLGVLAWLSSRRLSPAHIALASVFVTPVIYLVQPLGGVHFTATAMAVLAADAVGLAIVARRISLPHVGAALVVAGAAVATIRLPGVRAFVALGTNEGALEYAFPGGALWIPMGICFGASLANLMVSLRSWPDNTVDRVVGAAGVAAGSLMGIQWLALDLFGSGSFYVVKKHGFMVVTLGAVNLARLLARVLPQWRLSVLRSCAVGVAALGATAVGCKDPGWELHPIIAAQRFAEEFARTSAAFSPDNTTAYLSSVSPTANMLISTASFRDNIDSLYKLHGTLDRSADFVMIDGSRDASCILAADERFSVVRASCLRTIRSGAQQVLGRGGGGAIYLQQGWFEQESWGVWGGERPGLEFQLAPKDHTLTALVQVFLTAAHPTRDVVVLANDVAVATWSFGQSSPSGERIAHIPASVMAGSGLLTINFVSTTPLFSPGEAGISNDPRRLGIGLSAFAIE